MSENAKNTKSSRLAISVAIGVTVVAAVLIVFQHLRTRNVYAVVGGRVITKQDFTKLKTAQKTFSKTDTERQLILDAVLRNEAAKAGIKVGSPEVSFQNIQSMEQQLMNRELHSISILQVQTYWGGTKGPQAEPAAKQALDQRAAAWFKDAKPAKDILSLSDNAGKAYVNSPTFIAGTMINVPDIGSFGGTQKEALAKLVKVGDYTPVTRSEAKFYFIDRLEAKATGPYKDWNEFEEASYKQAIIYKDGWDWRRMWIGV